LKSEFTNFDQTFFFQGYVRLQDTNVKKTLEKFNIQASNMDTMLIVQVLDSQEV